MLKYVRNNLENEYGILELQDKILEIMVYIDSFCKQHSIDYCLIAGSALGAKRHQGFIPWDDDIDIYMSENDYLKFSQLFNKCGDCEHYYLQEWGKTDFLGCRMISMAKLRLNGSEISEKAYLGWNMHQGIFVDIFVVHNCSNNRFMQKIQYLMSESVVLKGLQIRGYVAKNIKDKMLLTLIRCVPTAFIKKIGLMWTYFYKNKNTKYMHGFIDTRGFSRAVFPRNIIFPTKYTKFENVQLRVPCDVDAYLKIQFGKDYMTPPPKEKRPICKHTSEWRINSEYKAGSFCDEKKLI